MTTPETDVSLRSLEDWLRWRDRNPWSVDPTSSRAIVERATRCGVISPHLGSVPPGEIEVASDNYRESFKARSLNARARAVLDHLATMPEAASPLQTRIFAPEALSRFALSLRGRYPRFLGSEYLPERSLRERFFPIPHQDLQALSLPDASFDIAICNDVFEHLPDLRSALRELARILRGGGVLLATLPFAYNQHDGIVKAVRERGEIRFLCEPEYHGDPLGAEGGALVYQIPGWSILESLREAEFRHAEMRWISSPARGICATEIAGIFMLRAVR